MSAAKKGRAIDLVVIHCADTPSTMDIGVAEIRKWHTEERGWSDIGYHWVIRRDGTLEQGRDEAVAGAHVAGHNSRSIGVCMIGGKGAGGIASANFTPAQWHRLDTLLRELAERYPNAEVLGHRDLDPKKACPAFDVRRWLKTRPS